MIKLKIKSMLYFVLYYTGILYVVVRTISILFREHKAIILYYHRFCEDNGEKGLLPRLNINEFRKQMRHITLYYQCIDMNKLIDKLRSGEQLRTPTIVISIDDGYQDNYTLAYQILKSFELTCIIYLTAGLIGEKTGLWVDELEYLLLNARVDQFTINIKGIYYTYNISTHIEKKNTLKEIFKILHKTNNTDRNYVINTLYKVLQINLDDIKKRSRIMLNWDEVVEMADNGILFGAHTLSHPYLPVLPKEEAYYEIHQSKSLIENVINCQICHFAVPNGKCEDFTDELRDYSREIGIESIVMTECGVVGAASDLFALKRALPPPPIYYFACEVARLHLLETIGVVKKRFL